MRPRREIRRLFHPSLYPWGAILMLHRIDTINPDRLWYNEHLKVSPDYLNGFLTYAKRKGFSFVSLDELVDIISKKKRARRILSITLDDGYKDNYLDAVADWNGKANTEHLKAIGLNKEIVLADGEYIPSLGEMYLIYLNRKALNQALELIGSDPIKDDWYWTSTESSATNAWLLNLNNGLASSYTKASSTNHVRPVSAFIS